ncbi:MAG TPA: LysR family transcriptional regulator [Burkholderiales bacterium]|jgi:DNA-binding transcriptional LysR family regulator|nr:LysR family transcriptional regulator [Burkholderiales bacterium]
MNHRLDLNLLPIAVALYEERGVSRTATRLGMSQPAVSAALARLRKAFDDPLFVRTARGMEPTPRAQALIAPARDVLSRVERDVLSGLAFDPATANVTFTFALSDVGEMVFVPRILESLQRFAPLASVRSVSPPPNELREGLETGEIDLAVGYFPDLKTSNFFQQRLFTHHFCCLLRADHPITSKRLSLKQFLGLRHVAVHAEGRSQELFERFLVRNKIHPKVVLVTPHFMSLPTIIAKSDLVATVPHAIGMYFSGSWANIKTVLPPFTDAPRIVLKQHWHRKSHHDPRNQWLRRTVSGLFNQESDEWKGKAGG